MPMLEKFVLFLDRLLVDKAADRTVIEPYFFSFGEFTTMMTASIARNDRRFRITFTCPICIKETYNGSSFTAKEAISDASDHLYLHMRRFHQLTVQDKIVTVNESHLQFCEEVSKYFISKFDSDHYGH